MAKAKTEILCKKCKKNFLDIEPWGKNKTQHYRITCSNCGFAIEVNESFLRQLEELERTQNS